MVWVNFYEIIELEREKKWINGCLGLMAGMEGDCK